MRICSCVPRSYAHRLDPALPAPGFGRFAEPSANRSSTKPLLHNQPANQRKRRCLQAPLQRYFNPTHNFVAQAGNIRALTHRVRGNSLNPFQNRLPWSFVTKLFRQQKHIRGIACLDGPHHKLHSVVRRIHTRSPLPFSHRDHAPLVAPTRLLYSFPQNERHLHRGPGQL